MRYLIMLICFLVFSLMTSKAGGNAELDWEYMGKWQVGVASRAAISSDGRQIAVNICEHDADICDIEIYDMDSRSYLGQLPIGAAGISDIAYSPSENLVASAQFLWAAYIWNPPQRRPVAIIRHQNASSLSVAFSHNNAYLAVGWVDGLIQIWDVQSQVILRELSLNDGGKHRVDEVMFSPDGRYLVSGGDSLLLWDISDWSLVRTLVAASDWPEYVVGVSFSADGNRLAVTHRAGKVQVFRIPDGESIEIRAGNISRPIYTTNPLITNDGRFLLFGSSIPASRHTSYQILVYDLESLAYIGEVHQEGIFSQILLAPDQEHLYAVAGGGIHSWRIDD